MQMFFFIIYIIISLALEHTINYTSFLYRTIYLVLRKLFFNSIMLLKFWYGGCTYGLAWCLYIVPRYKGRGDKCECRNSGGISLLSVVGKLYGRVLIKIARGWTECAIGEEQCGFRQGRGCMDQVFAVRQVCEKYLANGKDVSFAFMDLENTSDTIDRHGMWQMQRVYGVGGKWFKAEQSFYIDSRACVRVGNDVSEWFPINVGLRHGSVISSWLFNIYGWCSSKAEWERAWERAEVAECEWW